MPAPKLSEAQFVDAWHRHGSANRMAEATGLDLRQIFARRERMIGRGFNLPTAPAPGYETRTKDFREAGWTFPREKALWVDTGPVVVFSDAHYWPGIVSTAHTALLEVIREVKPRAVIANGDIFDGASVTRHDPFGWHGRPNVREELDTCKERLSEIEQAIPRGTELIWNIGNHDVRFERALCAKAPEFAGMEMVRLADHFDAWDLRWSTMINSEARNPVMVKHRQAGGVHAAYNNSLKSGLSMVTGHTHILEVKPWVDYRGRRWGVQTGTLADHHGPQFEYTENNASPACSGFAVLTFHDGAMSPPELCEVIDDRAWFRGNVIAEGIQ